jgi:hypothetical protein
MAVAGLAWLTYLSTPLANYLSPYNSATGILGEGLVMLWLLLMSINAEKWVLRVNRWRATRAASIR